jgi:RNA polymerase sigma-70 factor, ECF subfamily
LSSAKSSLQLHGEVPCAPTYSEMLMSQKIQFSTDHDHVHSLLSDDLALLQAFQEGCKGCFEALFARYWKLVFTIAWKILRQRNDAEDIVQEVFLTIYLQSDRYDASRGSVKAWIAQYAHFKALLRRRHLQGREQRNLDELAGVDSGLRQFQIAQGTLEQATFIKECLAALNPRQRRTVELVHVDGYTLLETAAVLKQSLANTRNLYYRGMKTLRSQMSPSRSLGQMEVASGNRAQSGARPEALAFGTDI